MLRKKWGQSRYDVQSGKRDCGADAQLEDGDGAAPDLMSQIGLVSEIDGTQMGLWSSTQPR